MGTLDRTVLQMVDLAEQGKGHAFVFLPPDGRGIGPVAIDDYECTDTAVHGYRISPEGQRSLVISYPITAEWCVISTNVVKRLTHEESLRVKAGIQKAAESLERELFPEEAEARTAMLDVLKKGVTTGGQGVPGQYL